MKKITILTLGIVFTLIAIPTIMAKGAEENIPTNANENSEFKEDEGTPRSKPEQAQIIAQKGKQNAPKEMAQENENLENSNAGKEDAPGLKMKENKEKTENSNQGKGFGDYVSKIAKSQIPKAMNQIDLNFGEKFIKPFTPGTEQDPKTSTVQNKKTTTQEWFVGLNNEYAAQTYTWTSEDQDWKENGHEYVIIWSKNQINETENQTKHEFTTEDSYPLDGKYTGYYFDVTKLS